jgi:CheY-like chemotaxis protein
MSSVPPSSLLPSVSTSALKVLVVDDDGANRLLAVRWLDRVGVPALEAENGE